MVGIIGKKLGMTQIFNEQGQQIPVTVIEAEPNPVTKVVDAATAGFASVELGYGRQRSARESARGERTSNILTAGNGTTEGCVLGAGPRS